MATPIPFPGGYIDRDRITEGEIYIGTPTAAVAPPGCEVAEKYTTYVRTRQFDKISSLFTPDAVLFLTGQQVIGTKAIDEFYDTKVRPAGPQPVAVAYTLLSPGVCLVQIAASRPVDGGREYFASSISQFLVEPDGRASMMLAFGRRSPVVSGAVKAMGGRD